MSTSHTPPSIDQTIIDTLTEFGPMIVADLRRVLGVRRQRLLVALTALTTSGQIKKGHIDKTGNDKRQRRVTTYARPDQRSGGGSQGADGGSLSQPHAAAGAEAAMADAEFADTSTCPSCSGLGPRACEGCSEGGWYL